MTPLLIDTPLTRAALVDATKAHAGQFRDDKVTPFIEHPIAVANGAVKLYRDNPFEFFPAGQARDLELLTVTGLYHDIAEDCPQYSEDGLVDSLFAWDRLTEAEREDMLDALQRLNKHRHTDYLAFTLATYEHWLSRLVKRADIAHNALTTPKGARLDKYRLALHILETP